MMRVVKWSILLFYVNVLVEWVMQGEFPVMTPKQAQIFGAMVREQRESLGMNQAQLARLVGTRDSTINRIERGAFATPRPDKLVRLAEHLRLPLVDIFAAVGYVVPTELPAWEPYLRAKYPELSDAAIDELKMSFERIANSNRELLPRQEPTDDRHRSRIRRPTSAELVRRFGKDFA